MAEAEQWPGWWFGPDGNGHIFDSPEEVPEGWVNDLRDVKKVRTEAQQASGIVQDSTETKSLGQEERAAELLEEEAAKLAEEKSQKELAEMLEELSEIRVACDEEALEFLPNWPKIKLARLYVENKD